MVTEGLVARALTGDCTVAAIIKRTTQSRVAVGAAFALNLYHAVGNIVIFW